MCKNGQVLAFEYTKWNYNPIKITKIPINSKFSHKILKYILLCLVMTRTI